MSLRIKSTMRPGRLCRWGLLLLLIWCAAPLRSHAQAGQWQAHTSLREVTSLDATEKAVWVGTTGGVYSYTAATGEITRYTIAQGLHGTRVNAVLFDEACGEAGCAWIGYADGVLEEIDAASGTVHTYRDIERATRFPSREIHRLVLHGDSLLVTTAFGLVVFDTERREVRDTYDQLGTLEPATAVRDAVAAPLPSGEAALWLATAGGIAVAPLGAPNLKDPAAWTVEQAGLSSLDVRAIAYFDGRIFAGTAIDLVERSPDGSYAPVRMTTHPVTDLVTEGSRLVGSDRFAVFVVDHDGLMGRFPLPAYEAPVALDVLPGDRIWFGDRNEGLFSARIDFDGGYTLTDLRDCSGTTSLCYPEGPYHNQFFDLEIDAAGSLWTAGGPGTGMGFHRLDPHGRWTDFIGRNVEALVEGASFSTIHVQNDGTAWVGSEGFGLAMVTDEDEVTIYNRHNSELRAAESTTDADYIIIGGIAEDPDGAVWATNVSAPRPLHVRNADGEWTSLPFASACSGISSATGTYGDLFIDSFGQKWIAIVNKQDLKRDLGLIVLDTKDTPADGSDDDCRFFGEEAERGQGLPDLQVNAIIEDRDGLIWVATDEGPAYLLNTGVVASDPGAAFNWPLYADRALGTYLFHGLKINDLAVDPANRLWAATDAGVWLAGQGEDGYEEVLHFTAENSPLLADLANALAVHPETGEVFFSTANGLISYRGDAVRAASEPRDLFIYPNPVRVQEMGEPAIYIDGLVEETEIMIMSPDGSVVTRFEARGGRARWDGRDSRGRIVPSGVYLVVAIGRNGERTAYGKAAIIR